LCFWYLYTTCNNWPVHENRSVITCYIEIPGTQDTSCVLETRLDIHEQVSYYMFYGDTSNTRYVLCLTKLGISRNWYKIDHHWNISQNDIVSILATTLLFNNRFDENIFIIYLHTFTVLVGGYPEISTHLRLFPFPRGKITLVGW
jgi:hypothetical protein